MNILLICFSVWFIGIFIEELISILNYIITNETRTIVFDKKWSIVLSGNKAKQFVIAKFFLFTGFMYSFYTLWFLSDNSWWVGILVAIPSLFFIIHTTVNAKQNSSKKNSSL